MVKLLTTVILMSTLAVLYSQETKVFEYESDLLVEKPKPTKGFVEWISENNDKLGKTAQYNTRKTTKVTIVFVVDSSGTIISPKVWRGIGQGYDLTAHGLIKNNPYKWNPGKTVNMAVNTQVYYQIDFIKNENRIMNKENKSID